MNPTLSILAACTLKATVILALATTVAFLFRRSSAAHRYALWFSALAVILLLPFLSYMTPGWGIIPRAEVLELMASGSPETEQDPKFPTPRADTTVADITAAPRSVDAVIPTPTDSQMSRPSERDDTALLLSSREARSGLGEAVDGGFFALTWSVASAAFGWIWLAGALAAAAPILFGWIGIRRLAKEATPVGDGREVVFLNTAREAIGLRAEVRLLRGPRGAMPMTWGIGLWSPARILLPVEASEWKDERLRSVLLHELAHVRRRDCLTQLLARVACAGYWFHPWVWITASRLLVEREQACDDVVLLHSKSPSHYARDLVEVASRASIEFPSARIGIAMARSCKLDGRLRAILDPRRNRTGLTRRLVVGLGLLTALVALPVASLQWAAEPLTQVNIEETAENEKPSPTASTISAPIPDETDAFTLGVIDGGTGQPLAGATVTADDAHGDRDFVTDAEGRCIVPIRENSSNYLWVRVWSDGFVPMRLLWRPTPDAPAIPSSYTLALDRATVIGGRIVDDVGEPVSGATVVLNIHAQTDRPHESVGIPFTEVMSGKDGRWEYSGAPAAFERIEIGVHHPNYASHDRWKNHPMRGIPHAGISPDRRFA